MNEASTVLYMLLYRCSFKQELGRCRVSKKIKKGSAAKRFALNGREIQNLLKEDLGMLKQQCICKGFITKKKHISHIQASHKESESLWPS